MLKKRARPAPPQAAVPENLVVYAIGDIHGRRDLLDSLLDHIVSDPTRDPDKQAVVVGLGDYIDRGPASREVLDRLIQLQNTPGMDVRLLKGNHESILLSFLEEPLRGIAWCEFGGRNALASYGVQAPLGTGDEAAWTDTRDRLLAALPKSHLYLLNELDVSLTLGDYIFVHAGLRPGLPLEEQTPEDLIWIRQPFLDSKIPWDRVVVHGHSISESVHIDNRRIGIDTGAYATGVLTALRLEGASRRLLQTNSIATEGSVGVIKLQV